MKVLHIAGEPTRFRVEGASLECGHCKRLFSRLKTAYAKLKPGDHCPVCEEEKVVQAVAEQAGWAHAATFNEGPVDNVPRLGVRWHLVDIALWHPIGQCSCEGWMFHRKPEVEKLSPSELAGLSHLKAEKLRCAHIAAARTAALNITVKQHEHERMKNAKGQLEEAAP